MCTGCEKELTKEAHTFECLYDDSYHWNECSKCHFKEDKAEHTPEDGKCKVCGAAVKAPETTTSTASTTEKQAETTSSGEGKGCGSFVGAGASLAGVIAIGAALVFTKKKKDRC